MSQKLVIVESPAKAKTIKKFLGRGFKVEASMGHVRDLPKSQLGIDPENNFEPKYITIRGKGEILNKLRKEAKNSDQVFLATDPDREGEAISWHLANILNMDENSACRIEFNEITSQAVKNAIQSPRPINMDLVDAQQARRVLDRVVGYKISPLLWRKIKKGLSAGRVQSVATRIICDREKEIQEFVPKEYWTLTALFKKKGEENSFNADFYGLQNQKIQLNSIEDVQSVEDKLKGAKFYVNAVKKGTKKRNAPPPFTTSTLQQEASRKLGFTTKKTMMLAQQLYEGIDIKGQGAVGLVTYIRTDSTRVSKEAQIQAKEYILNRFGNPYVPDKPNQYKGRKNTQDAHEAIRPTSLDREPDKIKDSLKRDQYRLYRLIYERFIASQMTPALYDTVTIDIIGNQYIFKAKGSKKIFLGYTVIYNEESDKEKEKDIALPILETGEELILEKLSHAQHFTQPPPRYTEASLVKTLEEMGIGRPSTYAPIISTIISRGYVVRESRTLLPTELGFIVNDLMIEYFPDIVDYKFTADMEEQLDMVEEGKKDWRSIVKDFYLPFQSMLKHADEEIGRIEIADEESDVKCEKCGSNMVIKTGRYGKFLACPNFPECRNTKPIIEEIDVVCPKCKEGKIVMRKSKKGRKFYGCDNYPNCDFVSWDRPAGEACPQCQSYMTVREKRDGSSELICSNKACGYRKEESKR